MMLEMYVFQAGTTQCLCKKCAHFVREFVHCTMCPGQFSLLWNISEYIEFLANSKEILMGGAGKSGLMEAFQIPHLGKKYFHTARPLPF